MPVDHRPHADADGDWYAGIGRKGTEDDGDNGDDWDEGDDVIPALPDFRISQSPPQIFNIPFFEKFYVVNLQAIKEKGGSPVSEELPLDQKVRPSDCSRITFLKFLYCPIV